MAAIGVITLELKIEHAHSLKEKRHVVRSLIDRLRHKFNVAVAEIDYHDQWQMSLISAVTVSPSKQYAAGLLDLVEQEAAEQLGPMLVDVTIEWM